MATLKDIARLTGLSATTVSRALRECDDVTEKTRKRVKAVADILNYKPNPAARKLVSGRSGMVGLVIDTQPADFEQAHFFAICEALSKAMAERDVDLVLHLSSDEDPLTTYERLIARGTMDGFVLLVPKPNDPRIALLSRHAVPFVVHGKPTGHADCSHYALDTSDATITAFEYLAGFGHKRIALLNGPASWSVSHERSEAFCTAAARLGLDQRDQLSIRHGDTSQIYGQQSALDLLSRVADAPTAFICCNSLVAQGVLAAMEQLNLHAPEDISIVAHDDLLPQVNTAQLAPPLTVTLKPVAAAGEVLADYLVQQINGRPASQLQKIEKAVLIERNSVARPRPQKRSVE